MATIKNFEELEIWKSAFVQAEKVYRISQSFRTEQYLYNQLNAAAGSVMDNIAEGFERKSTKEFIHFLFIAKGSNGEVRSQMIRGMCLGLISVDDLSELRSVNEKLSKQLYSFISYLRKSGYKVKP